MSPSSGYTATIALFVARVRQRKRSFELNDRNQEAVAELVRMLDRSFRTGIRKLNTELIIRHASGPQHLAAITSPLPGADGRFSGVVLVLEWVGGRTTR